MHSELSVGCFFTLCQVCFTVNFAKETSLVFLFLGGGGQDPLAPTPKSAPATNLPIWSWYDASIRTVHDLDRHITICKPVVTMCCCVLVEKLQQKGMVFLNRKEVNYAKLIYVVLATQIVFFFFFINKCIIHFKVLTEWRGLHLFINSMTLHLV